MDVGVLTQETNIFCLLHIVTSSNLLIVNISSSNGTNKEIYTKREQ